jgi:YggT family protein
MIHTIFSVLGFVISAYSLLLFIRVILSWFPGSAFSYSKPFQVICGIADPYLFWFNRFSFLRVGRINFSPIVALVVLTIVTNIVFAIAQYGKITVGMILYLLLSVVWSAVSFVLGFFIIVLLLRLIAFGVRASMYTPFWQAIESISKPVMTGISSFLYKNRIVRFTTSLVSSFIFLTLAFIVLSIVVMVAGKFFSKLPF